jgi:hypothetical protein
VILGVIKDREHPALLDLLTKSQTCGIDVDGNWALAICSINLIEAAVNKKLEDLKKSTKGDFSERLKRLRNAVKVSESRDIQQLLPKAMYDRIRSKLDHASHKYKVTPAEAGSIYFSVVGFLEELFPN